MSIGMKFLWMFVALAGALAMTVFAAVIEWRHQAAKSHLPRMSVSSSY